jgi:hypothetical protein
MKKLIPVLLVLVLASGNIYTLATNLACTNKITKSIPGNCHQTSLSESPAVSSNTQGDLR